MKTAKKSLAVLIVVVLALGMIPLASAATASDFTDASAINNTEAVTILSTLGIFQGYQDGSFGPDRTITRAEATTIIARMLLGSLADSLPMAPTGFKDVPSTHWASNYISYCVSAGIVKGYGDGRFGPSDTLTASQFAVMLLRALGFGTKGEYEGPTWQVNAVVDGMKYGILTGDADFSASASRDSVALYAFNALIYSVDTSNDQVWGMTGMNTTTGDITWGWVTVPGGGKDSLGWTVFKLGRAVNSKDDLGRPATNWYYGTNETPIISVTNTPVKVFTTDVTQADLFRVINAKGTLDTTINTPTKQVQASMSSLSGNTNTAGGTAGSLNPYGTNGNGVITEVYKTGDGNTAADYSVVVLQPGFAKVNVTSTKATTTTGAFDTYSVGGQSGRVFSSIVNEDNDLDTAVIAGTVAKDDMAIYYKGAANLYVEAVDTLTGVVTSVTSAGVVTIDGAKTSVTQSSGIAPNGILVSKDAQSFYVDKNGYILGIKEAAKGPVPLVLVISVDQYSELDGNKVVTNYTADIVDLDGNVVTVPTTLADYNKFNNAVLPLGQIYQYNYTASTGVYSGFTTTFSGDAVFSKLSNVNTVTNKSTALTLTSGSVNLAGSSTKFVLVNYMTLSDNSRVPDGTVTVYNGINNVPTYTGLTQTTAVSVPITDANGNATAADNVAEIVYIYDDYFAASTNKFVYVTNSWTQTGDGWLVDVIIDGAYNTIVVPQNSLASLTSLAGNLYTSVSVGSDGAITSVAPPTPTTGTIESRSGLLFLNGVYANLTIADDTPVYTITEKTTGVPDVSIGQGADLSPVLTLSTDGSRAYVNSDSTTNSVTAIYIIVPAS